jgi:putative hydrolase of HD superfamily
MQAPNTQPDLPTPALRLDGVRVTLRDMRLDDLDRYAHWMDPQQAWHALDGPYYPPASGDRLRRKIERQRRQIESGDRPDPRDSLVIADRETDMLNGHVTWYWQSEETWWLSVGIGLYDPAVWGKGLGYEALGLWSDYLFAAMPQLARLDLRTWSGNTGMMRLAGKIGFREEARFRKARIVDGAYYDGLGYGVLREEWAARFPDGFAASLTATS